jgi:hypothetical protein
MTIPHGKDTKVYAGGYDLTAYFRSISVGGQADTAERSTFGDSSKEYIAGLREASLSGETILDGGTAVGTGDLFLSGLLGGTAWNWIVWMGGDSLGSRGVALPSLEVSYEPSAEISDVVVASVEGQSSGGFDGVTALAGLAQRSASGNGSDPGDGIAGGSNFGWAAYLYATAVAGSPTLTVSIQDSADNSTFAGLVGGTFTNVTAARAAQRLAGAGTVRQYVRAAWTLSGGSATFGVAFSRKGVL